jgi:hypothetical protein
MFFLGGGGGASGPFFLGEGPGFVLVLWREGTGVCLFLWRDQYTIFFSTVDFFFFYSRFGGTMAPAGPPIDPSLRTSHNSYRGVKIYYLSYNLN